MTEMTLDDYVSHLESRVFSQPGFTVRELSRLMRMVL